MQRESSCSMGFEWAVRAVTEANTAMERQLAKIRSGASRPVTYQECRGKVLPGLKKRVEVRFNRLASCGPWPSKLVKVADRYDDLAYELRRACKQGTGETRMRAGMFGGGRRGGRRSGR